VGFFQRKEIEMDNDNRTYYEEQQRKDRERKEQNRINYASMREAYLNWFISHRKFYKWVCETLNVRKDHITIGIDELLVSKDPHLNDIPLKRWDTMDCVIRSLAEYAGLKSWSLSDTVCVAKEMARQMIEEEKR